MSLLALSASFEYLCYGSTTIINSFTFTVPRSLESDVCRRQILTSKVDARAVRVNIVQSGVTVAYEVYFLNRRLTDSELNTCHPLMGHLVGRV